MSNNPTLEQARKRIAAHISLAATEMVPLAQAVDRVCGLSCHAPYALPEYSQSLYDGFALGMPERKEEELFWYALDGEIAAGDTGIKTVASGSACRIMTGALVPRGTWKIIPQESCVERDGRVAVEKDFAVGLADNIRKKGSRLRKGTRIVTRGRRLTPMDLVRLADFGMAEVEVYCLPEVHFFCTGSELVDGTGDKQPGKKYSSNRFQLAGLIQQAGASGLDHGSIADKRESLAQVLSQATAASPAMIISTGGMGPGKYDLLEESFARVGGKTIFSTLRLRPGKSMLFGILGTSLYFGLPGPPPAVHALFHALVRPALMAAGGMNRWRSKTVRARLVENIALAGADTLRLHEGILFHSGEICSVRLPVPPETPNCYLLCQAGRKNYQQGSSVSVLPFNGGYLAG